MEIWWLDIIVGSTVNEISLDEPNGFLGMGGYHAFWLWGKDKVEVRFCLAMCVCVCISKSFFF